MLLSKDLKLCNCQPHGLSPTISGHWESTFGAPGSCFIREYIKLCWLALFQVHHRGCLSPQPASALALLVQRVAGPKGMTGAPEPRTNPACFLAFSFRSQLVERDQPPDLRAESTVGWRLEAGYNNAVVFKMADVTSTPLLAVKLAQEALEYWGVTLISDRRILQIRQHKITISIYE